MKNIDNIFEYAHKNNVNFTRNLCDFLSIPSVSTDPNYKDGIQDAAEWLASYLKKIHVEDVNIFPTGINPIVYGKYSCADKNAPTILLYGHYDVQPVDPENLWHTPPFQPTIDGDKLFARGSSDMKGQIMASLCAIESLLFHQALKINIKFLFEGEEEIGSPSINSFLTDHRELLKSDIAFNLDAGMINAESPTITYGLRGIAFFELLITGPDHDLHSGSYGGVVENPAHVLSRIVAGLHDKNGHITIPGFYDDVLPLTTLERDELARLPIHENDIKAQTGAPSIWGEKEFIPIERIGARPTIDVNGFESGYTGIGQKTIIPSWAKAKLSSRLVPDQDPEKVHNQLIGYIKANAPHTIKWDLSYLSGVKACLADPQHPITQVFIESLEKVWESKVYFNRMGGSIPIVGAMQNILGIDSILSGFHLPDDNIHAPNEKISLSNWKRGIDAVIYFLYKLGNK